MSDDTENEMTLATCDFCRGRGGCVSGYRASWRYLSAGPDLSTGYGHTKIDELTKSMEKNNYLQPVQAFSQKDGAWFIVGDRMCAPNRAQGVEPRKKTSAKASRRRGSNSQPQVVSDAIKAIAVPPVPASGFGVNPDTGCQINLTRLSRRDPSGKDSCNGSKPWRLIQCPAGIIAGKVSDVDDETAQISFGLRERADVKGDFHEAENHVQQNCNMLWHSILQSGAELIKRIQTIAFDSNHRVCGVICREKRRFLWRG